jgi:hypothetical protein
MRDCSPPFRLESVVAQTLPSAPHVLVAVQGLGMNPTDVNLGVFGPDREMVNIGNCGFDAAGGLRSGFWAAWQFKPRTTDFPTNSTFC